MPRPIASIQAEITSLEAAIVNVVQSVTKDGVIVVNPDWRAMTKRIDELYQQLDRAQDIAGGTNSRYMERQVGGTGKRFPTSSGVGTWPLT